MMACPICDDYRDDGLCPWCVRCGYDMRACGCLELHGRVMLACRPAHAPCEDCDDQPRQAGDTVCGDCRFEAQRAEAPEAHEWMVRR